MKKWMLLPVIILEAGLLAVIYLTPARTGEDEPPASAHQMQAEYETEAVSV